MKKLFVCICLVGLMMEPALAIWPFGGKDEAALEQEKVNDIMRDVSKAVTEADQTRASGDEIRALSLYRKALKDLEDISKMNETTGTAWTGLRMKKVHCEMMIDTVLLSQATLVERHIGITDTANLEAQLLKEQRAAQGLPEIVDVEPPAVEDDTPPPVVEETQPKVTPTPEKPANQVQVQVQVSLTDDILWAHDLRRLKRFDTLETFLVKTLNTYPDSSELIVILAELRLIQERYDDAAMLADMIDLKAPGGDASALIKAGALLAQRQQKAAMDVIRDVIKAYPTQPTAYFNMAMIYATFKDEGQLDMATLFYRRSVELGGARHADLEKRLSLCDSVLAQPQAK